MKMKNKTNKGEIMNKIIEEFDAKTQIAVYDPNKKKWVALERNRVIEAWNPPAEIIKSWLLSTGNNIGSVWFIKKSNGKLRKMCYRLHCKKPSAAKIPGNSNKASKKIDRKLVDKINNNITVLDCNSVVRDENGIIKGRGKWKSIPLCNIVRIKAKNIEYHININHYIKLYPKLRSRHLKCAIQKFSLSSSFFSSHSSII